jgi:hypothetical protein
MQLKPLALALLITVLNFGAFDRKQKLRILELVDVVH